MPYPSLLDRDLSTQLLSYLSPVDIAKYGRVSKASRDAVNVFNNTAYDLERALAPFLSSSEYTTLRDFQELLGAVISGSQAVKFLDRAIRESVSSSDLDIFVKIKHAKTIGDWLESIRYHFQPRGSQPRTFSECYRLNNVDGHSTNYENTPTFTSTINIGELYGTADIRDVFSFGRDWGGQTPSIKILGTVYSPAQAILRFHSSVVMNIITAKCAYALYPVTTFHTRQSVKTKHANEEAQEQYITRGWSMVLAEEVVEGRAAIKTDLRFFGDNHC
ncbi:hypothetical protein HGRIS_005782 [Hohenbuehelia grisea]|uniref:F-box domain-containing protein n=1 Tax=Hohenbuehelia grisea TaxID=104357 RepID=A0ABR3JZZ3_9AGAR